MNFDFSYKAEEQLGELPWHVQERIRDKMRFYANQPNPFSFAKKLTDREGYRFRVGNHRALFVLKDGALQVFKIELRDKAYE